MINAIIKWGLICGVVMTILLYGAQILVFGDKPENFAAAEIAGYVGMVASLLIIVLAINTHFRGTNGHVGIWQRMLLGFGITFVAGAIFGLTNNIYTTWINPEFTDSYFNYYLDNLPVKDGPEYERLVKELEEQREMFQSPFMMFLVMAATVWMVGIIISILASIGHWYFTKRNTAQSA